jgi:hypothetical protein
MHLALERGYSDDGNVPVDRLVVNMLRHEHTAYDDNQNQDAHRAACEAIARKYPWLREECERQINRRAQNENFEEMVREQYEDEQAEAARYRQERVEQSKAVIGALSPGMTVTAHVRGYVREAVIVSVGRSRVKVAFRLKTGEEREAMVYARDVLPSNGSPVGTHRAPNRTTRPLWM